MIMDTCAKRFSIDCSPVAPEKNVIIKKNVRFTVITPCLLRVEAQREGKFCDEPTQSVWFRDFCECDFQVSESKNIIEIKTEKAAFVYSLKAGKMLNIRLADCRNV